MHRGLIVLLFTFLLLGSCNSRRNITDGEMHIFPKDYTGLVTIIFNQPDGEAPEMVNGMRVYRIPSSGVLKTQFKFVAGYFSCNLLRYCYVDGRDTTGIAEVDFMPADYASKQKLFMHHRSVKGDTMRYWVEDRRTRVP